MRTIRYGLVFDENEHQALQTLIDRERTTAASIIRKLIWHEAQRWGFQVHMTEVDPGASTREEAARVD